MSLNKAIESGKEHRKPYKGAKAIDPWCRNHGWDDWSRGDRTYKNDKREESAQEEIEEFLNESD